MPRTSMLLRRKADAAVEITALAAGAGPPAKSMPTRRIWRGLCGDGEAEGDIRNSRRVTVVHPFDSARGRAAKRYRSPEAEAIEISKNCAGTAHRLGPCAFTQAYRESKRVLRNNTNLGIARSQEFPPQPGGSVHWSARPAGIVLANRVFPSGSGRRRGRKAEGDISNSRRELGRLGKMLRVLSSGSLNPLPGGEREPETPSAMSVIANSTVLRLSKEAGLSSSSSRLDRFGGKE